MILLNTYLQDRFKNWTDDDLHDRLREIRHFGGDESEAMLIEAESKRRQEEWEAKQRAARQSEVA
jgi:hypothetical protein